MLPEKFIEITVQNHQILHGFDQNNMEIIEDEVVESPLKKLIAIERIQSISQKYILISYAFERLIYWEYKGEYEELKRRLLSI
jgi:hypothetical protein